MYWLCHIVHVHVCTINTDLFVHVYVHVYVHVDVHTSKVTANIVYN